MTEQNWQTGISVILNFYQFTRLAGINIADFPAVFFIFAFDICHEIVTNTNYAKP